VADLDSTYRPELERHLDAGEELRGICVASQQKGLFKGGAAAIGVTDRRLLVQELDRRGRPDGQALSIPPERIAEAKAGGAGGGWGTLESAIADRTAVRLKLRLTDGSKLNLMLMRGEGRVLGGSAAARRSAAA